MVTIPRPGGSGPAGPAAAAHTTPLTAALLPGAGYHDQRLTGAAIVPD